jgi:hypothetical protein
MFHRAKRHASPEQDACANASGDSIPLTFRQRFFMPRPTPSAGERFVSASRAGTFRQRSFMPRPGLFFRQILLSSEPLQGDFVMEI